MVQEALRPEHERYARVESVRLGGVPMAVEWLPYGVGTAGPHPEIVATYGLLEMEYAAFRRGAAVMDRPDRATLAIRGKDRVDFLNRMVTQDLKGMSPGMVRQAFWLNRKGRVEADLLLCELPDRMLVDVDCHDAARTRETLGEFVFSEEVQIAQETEEWVRVSVHGPHALDLLHQAGADAQALRALETDLACAEVAMTGAGEGTEPPKIVVARRDQCAAPGVELWIPAAQGAALFDAFTRVQADAAAGQRRARPAGWYAYNIARIEAGTPLAHVDFGPDNLPHETGVLHSRVSFRKGCYLGQEIVARMESLGKPKQQLVALRMEADLLPTAGSPVFERTADGEPGSPVGTVTSSTLSPMLGSVPVAFAMVRSAHAAPGSVLVVPAEGGRVIATVCERLAFLTPEGKPQ